MVPQYRERQCTLGGVLLLSYQSTVNGGSLVPDMHRSIPALALTAFTRTSGAIVLIQNCSRTQKAKVTRKVPSINTKKSTKRDGNHLDLT